MASPLHPDHVPHDLICPICFNMPLQPRILKPCSHMFCKDCIKESLARRKTCPVCQRSCEMDQVLPLEHAGLAKRIWANVAVKCDATGCKWTGCVSDFNSHDCSCQKNNLEVNFWMEEIARFNQQIQDHSRMFDALKVKISDLKRKKKNAEERLYETRQDCSNKKSKSLREAIGGYGNVFRRLPRLSKRCDSSDSSDYVVPNYN